MSSLSVSIVVPVFNVENFLAKCLESLVNQTIKNYEIIIVNDGSTDKSQLIIDEYKNKYPKLICAFKKKNGGLSTARNLGIKKAKGEYIGFVDSDDFCDITMFEKLYNKAKTNDADISICGYKGINFVDGSIRTLLNGKLEFYGYPVKENPDLYYFSSCYAWNKLIKRSLFQTTGIRFPKGLIFEDIPTIYSLYLKANKIVKVEESLYFYTENRSSSITSVYNKKLLDIYKSLGVLVKYFKREKQFDLFYNQLEYICVKHIIYRFRSFSKFHDKELKLRILENGFKFLDDNFPDWKINKNVGFYFYKNNFELRNKEIVRDYWLEYCIKNI